MLAVLANCTLTVSHWKYIALTRPGQGENPFIFALKLNASLS